MDFNSWSLALKDSLVHNAYKDRGTYGIIPISVPNTKALKELQVVPAVLSRKIRK